jgi:hypothetical protein
MPAKIMIADKETDRAKREDELKKLAQQMAGLDLEKIVSTRTFVQPDPQALLFVPFGPQSDYKPADKYKEACRKIAQPGVEDNYLLLASIRKLSEHYKTITTTNFMPYLQDGIDKELAKITEKDEKKAEALAEKKMKDVLAGNLKKYEKNIATAVKSLDAAWTEQVLPVTVTPPDVFVANPNIRNLQPDDGTGMDQNGALAQFIDVYGDNQDKKHYNGGKRFYVARYKKAKTKDGKNTMALDHVEVWKKKEN